MRLLLDTHVFLWALHEAESLSVGAYEAIGDPDNDVFVSAASFWEISIKHYDGKLTLDVPVKRLMEISPYQPLAVQPLDGLIAGSLPRHHKDPFDRMLIAQATTQGLTIVTRDTEMQRYGIPFLTA